MRWAVGPLVTGCFMSRALGLQLQLTVDARLTGGGTTDGMRHLLWVRVKLRLRAHFVLSQVLGPRPQLAVDSQLDERVACA